MYKHYVTLLSCVLAFTCIANTRSSAQILNGNFSLTAGNDGFHFVDWSVVGGAAVLSNQFGVQPTTGTEQAFISSDQGGTTDVYGNISDTINPSANIATLESSLGINSTAINASYTPTLPQDGSAIYQTFTATGPETITFDYDFLTEEDPDAASYGAAYNNDFSFVGLNGTVHGLADSYVTNSTGTVPPLPVPTTVSPSYTDYESETGYQAYALSVPIAGVYTLAFGVVDGLTPPNTTGGNQIPSALLIDDIVATPAAAPEPSAILVLLALLGMGAAFVAKRQFSLKGNGK